MSKILVKAHSDGYRRAGLAFTKAGVELDASELTKAQRAAIDADPRLAVTSVTDSAAERKLLEAKVKADELLAAADAAANAALQAAQASEAADAALAASPKDEALKAAAKEAKRQAEAAGKAAKTAVEAAEKAAVAAGRK